MPPKTVLAAFDAPEPFMLKPLDTSLAALEWQADVLASLRPDGFRVAPPLRSRDGELVVEGWTAWPRLAGRHEPRWAEIVAAGERFHRALAGVERPAWLDDRSDRWAHADRLAWAEVKYDAPDQLIHGDLTGNVLFEAGLPPAIIDLSVYWRPAAYASAIVVADALLFHGASPDALPAVDPELLERAKRFRQLA
jgi:Ser/Thr protein kinase RdoA (MazF antagonist)